MSNNPVNRPGAVRRPGAPTTAATPANNSQKAGMPSLEELRKLPTFVDEGVDVDMNPENASVGRLENDNVTIVAAKAITQMWQRRDGSFPETSYPEVQLQISFKRDTDDDNDRPAVETYKYANVAFFAPTKDGNKVKVRPGVVKEGGYAPKPRKTDPGTLFLQSILDAGGAGVIARVVGDEGFKALVGLRVHVSRRKIAGQSEKAKAVLAVDYIDGIKPSSTENGGGQTATTQAVTEKVVEKPVAEAPVTQAQTTTQAVSTATATAAVAAPVVQAAATTIDPVEGLAEQALLELLATAEGGSIAIAKIPTTLIQIEAWRTHADRGGILKLVRDINFLSRATSPWRVEGDVVKL